MRLHGRALLRLLTLTALLAAGCGSAGERAQGTFSLGLTDAPVDDAARVVVTFDRVQLVPEEGEPLTVWEGFETVDLLSLRNCALFDLVPPTAVPAGTYGQVRLHIVAQDDPRFQPGDPARFPFPNFVELSDGTAQALTVPSGEQSGAKIQGPFEVPPGGTLQLLADFDLRKSLHLVEAGGSGTYHLRPVLRPVEAGGAAAIRGALLPADEPAFAASDRPVVYAWQGAGDLIDPETQLIDPAKVVASAVPNTDPTDDEPDGAFCLGPLEPGTYAVTAVAGIDTDADSGADRWDGVYRPETRAPIDLSVGEERILGSPFTLERMP